MSFTQYSLPTHAKNATCKSKYYFKKVCGRHVRQADLTGATFVRIYLAKKEKGAGDTQNVTVVLQHAQIVKL